jgi:hypothetical protein
VTFIAPVLFLMSAFAWTRVLANAYASPGDEITTEIAHWLYVMALAALSGAVAWVAALRVQGLA